MKLALEALSDGMPLKTCAIHNSAFIGTLYADTGKGVEKGTR